MDTATRRWSNATADGEPRKNSLLAGGATYVRHFCVVTVQSTKPMSANRR